MTQELIWKTQTALDKIMNLTKITKLSVAVAFIESNGIEWIEELVSKHNIPKKNVDIYLSNAFSTNKPSLLLERLLLISNVYIVFQRKLHAKVIYATDNNEDGKLILGSANLTWSGINSNLELTCISKVDKSSIIKHFFDHCKIIASAVDVNIIQKYKLLEPSLEDITENNPIVDKITSQPFTADDPEIPSKEILSSYYFNFDDYETLFPRNAVLNIQEIRQKRKTIENKMLNIHKHIKPIANELDLHEHWSNKHIISTLSPSPYNHYSVSWVGIRYGKSQTQIEELNPGATKDEGNILVLV